MTNRQMMCGVALTMAMALLLSSCSDEAQPEEPLGCRLNSDCPIGEICQEGSCVEDEEGCEGPECPCLQDSDCGAAQACDVETGSCIPIECLKDNDCGLSEVCVDAQCVTDVNADRDRDGVPDNEDNCPEVADSTQEDNDADGQGDACDLDDDNDGLFDGSDNCPLVANLAQHDHDSDGAGNACDEDWVGLTLTGRVVSPLPIDVNVEGTVALRGISGQEQILALSGEGSFSAQGLEVGVYELRVSVSGHIPEVRVVSMQDLDIDLGEIAVVPESGDEAAPLRAQVTLSDGASPEGIFVRSTLGDTTLTDEEGRFELQLARLDHQLVLSLDGYQSATYDIQWNPDADEGGRFEVNGEDVEVFEGFTLAADLSARVSGLITSPLENVDFAAIATVRLVAESTRLLQVESDGVFRGDTLRPGLYALQVEARGHLPFSTLVSITSGDNDLGEFSMTPEFDAPESAAQLVGRVQLGEGSDDGVVVRYILNDVPVDTTLSDEEGLFSFAAARTTAQLSFQKVGFVSRTITVVYAEERERFEFEGQDLAQTPIELSREPAEGVIRVNFTFEPDWIPLDQRSVNLRVLGADYSANRPRVIESEDAEVFTSVPDGDFIVTASRAGFTTANQVALLDPQTRDITLTMTLTLTDMAQAQLDLEGTTLSAAEVSAALEDGVSFRNADLSGITLSGSFNALDLDLSGVNLSNANIPGVDLSGVNLTGVNFFGANAEGVTLAGADLTGANFSSANLSDASFRAEGEAIPDSPCADDAERPAVLLANAIFNQTTLTGVDMRGVNLEGVDFDGASLTGASLGSACLQRSNMILTNLSDANFDRADLSESSMINAILLRTSLRAAVMDRVGLGSAVFELADLSCLEEVFEVEAPVDEAPPLNPCDDAFEPNDSPAGATPLEVGVLGGLGLCAGDDEEDFFSMTLNEGDTLDLRVHFDAQVANVDIQVLNENLFVVGGSAGIESLERVTFTAQNAGTYFLRVFHFSGEPVSYLVERVDGVDVPACEGTSLIDANLNGANLIGTNFKGADLDGVSMIGAIIGQTTEEDELPIVTSFEDARMVGVSANNLTFDAANFSNANLSRALLNNASFLGADLTNTNFTRAQLGGVNIRSREINATNFTEAKLRGAVLDGISLNGVTLNGAELVDASFVECTFSDMSFDGADFSRADLTLASFTDADLRGATFLDTKLVEISLTGGNLSSVNLSGANLSGAAIASVSMQGINLSGADLSGATLAEADMTNCYADGADFSFALLSGVTADRCSLRQATFSNTEFSTGVLTDVSFIAADLSGALFSNATSVGQLNMTRAQMIGAIFVFSEFTQLNCSEATLDNVLIDSVAFNQGTFDRASMVNVRALFTNFTNTSAIDAEMREGIWISSNLTASVLTGANLFNTQMNGNNLQSINLSNANMKRASFRGAFMGTANLEAANMNDADFSGADLFGASLNGAFAQNADFRDASLGSAQWVAGNIRQALFDRALLESTNLQGTQMVEASLRDADITDADFTLTNVMGADFTGVRAISFRPPTFDVVLTNDEFQLDAEELLNGSEVNMASGTLSSATIQRGDFSRLLLGGPSQPGAFALTVTDSTFTASNFGDARVQSVNFTNTTFNDSRLDATFDNVTMDNVTMDGVFAHFIQAQNLVVRGGDFSGSAFYNANFSSARFSNTDLSSCDLRGADFLDATLFNVALSGAIYDNNTQWPTGFEPDLLGAVNIDAAGDLSDAQMSGAVFDEPLSDVVFSRADLSEAIFRGALNNVDLSDADLTGALFGIQTDPPFTDVVFTNALLDQASFSSLTAANLSLADVSMTQAEILGCTFPNLSVAGADLSESALIANELGALDARGLVASQLRVENTEATGGQWSGSEVTLASFRNSNLSGSDMSAMTLTDSTLLFVNFSDVDFSGADLRRNLFSEGQFTGADFSNADLSGTRFETVNLEGVDFTGANLTDAAFIDVNCPNGVSSVFLYNCGIF